MSDFYYTNPEHPPAPKPARGNVSWTFKNSVVESFMSVDVPLRVAEIAVIDMKAQMNILFHAKIAPHVVVEMLFGDVERIYKRENGTWAYT